MSAVERWTLRAPPAPEVMVRLYLSEDEGAVRVGQWYLPEAAGIDHP